MSRITAWSYRVEQALRDRLGDEVPEDWLASRAPDDDDLPWPVERVRYHWSTPRLSEQEWPRHEMPDDVAEAFVELLTRRRARDPKD